MPVDIGSPPEPRTKGEWFMAGVGSIGFSVVMFLILKDLLPLHVPPIAHIFTTTLKVLLSLGVVAGLLSGLLSATVLSKWEEWSERQERQGK